MATDVTVHECHLRCCSDHSPDHGKCQTSVLLMRYWLCTAQRSKEINKFFHPIYWLWLQKSERAGWLARCSVPTRGGVSTVWFDDLSWNHIITFKWRKDVPVCCSVPSVYYSWLEQKEIIPANSHSVDISLSAVTERLVQQYTIKYIELRLSLPTALWCLMIPAITVTWGITNDIVSNDIVAPPQINNCYLFQISLTM